MKRILMIGGLVLAAIAAVVAVKGEALLLASRAGAIETYTLAETEALLAPGIRVYEPADTTPGARLPALVMFHGCAGYNDAFLSGWADVAHEAGYIAFGIDSFGPRGYDRDASLATICTGKALIGMERAADIRAAIDIVAKDPRVDPARIVVAGWSHGAWSLMDLLAMEVSGRTPPALKGDPAAAYPRAPVNGEIFVYPYCGPGAMTRIAPWTDIPPALALVAGTDRIVDGPQCKRLFEKLIAKGAPISLQYYPEADHVFDDPTLEPQYADYYDAEAHADAKARVRAYLKERAAASRG